MKITHITKDPEGGMLGTSSPCIWAYGTKGEIKPIVYFTKPKWMTKAQFTRVLERIKLEIYEGEKLL
jgi:hypothetical protein